MFWPVSLRTLPSFFYVIPGLTNKGWLTINVTVNVGSFDFAYYFFHKKDIASVSKLNSL